MKMQRTEWSSPRGNGARGQWRVRAILPGPIRINVTVDGRGELYHWVAEWTGGHTDGRIRQYAERLMVPHGILYQS